MPKVNDSNSRIAHKDGIVQLLFMTVYCVLDGCDVDTKLEFPISRVFACGRPDEV